MGFLRAAVEAPVLQGDAPAAVDHAVGIGESDLVDA
jgi:hypothetical protein